MKLYKVDPAVFYSGFALVGADSSGEANSYINKFKSEDVSNYYSSKGYSLVTEDDAIEDCNPSYRGIIHFGIFYSG